MGLEFNPEEQIRYRRHITLPEIGYEGQLKLKAVKVLLVGAGGLGSPAALYLAASGVGHIGLVDFDKVDPSNLHRQIIHPTSSVGMKKTESAKAAILAINPNVEVQTYDLKLTSENAMEILARYDLVIDGTDNFPTRYLVNDACVLLGKPNIYGSIYRFEGQTTIFCTARGPCYRCLYPEPPPPDSVPSCAEAGVLGVLPGVIGLLQSTEAIKTILGIGESLIGRLMLYDALSMTFREVAIRRDPNCPICGEHPSITALVDYNRFCGMENYGEVPEIEPEALLEQIQSQEVVALIDVREPYEHAESRIPGSILIPLGELPDRICELDPAQYTVFYCRSGMRSAKAWQISRQFGFEDAVNLRGGILNWTGPTEN